MKAVILAGGKGSRLKPLTDTIPKALIPLGEKTLIEEVLSSLPDTIDTVIITTKYLPEKIKERIGTQFQNKKIIYTSQTEGENGTWAALYSTKPYIEQNEQFLVLNCDDLFQKEELTSIVEFGKNGMGITHTTMPAKYHAIGISSENHITGLERHTNENREELVQDTFANGLFLLDGTVFTFPPVTLTDGELGLPQTLLAQKDIYPLMALQVKNWQPCNSFEDLEKIKAAP